METYFRLFIVACVIAFSSIIALAIKAAAKRIIDRELRLGKEEESAAIGEHLNDTEDMRMKAIAKKLRL